MSKDHAKENLEDIKKDIKNLINNLSKLKENSGEILEESFQDLTEAMYKIKDTVKDNIPSKGRLLYKGVDYMYGETIRKTVTIIGVSALIAYLWNRKTD